MSKNKFRGKRIDTGEWVYGQYFRTPLTDENSGTTPEAGWFFLTGEPRHCIAQNGCAFVVNLETVGQYTGLKDKEEKELYRYDLWEYCGEVYIVSWHPDEAKFYFKNQNAFATDDDHIEMQWSTHGFKVGNIYDNPELIGGTANE